MAQEREAYQLVRMLLAVIYAAHRELQERAPLERELRSSALSAATHLFESGHSAGSDEHVRELRQALLALDRLASLLEKGRNRGELPEDWTGDLLAVQGSASEALGEAITDWSHRQSAH